MGESTLTGTSLKETDVKNSSPNWSALIFETLSVISKSSSLEDADTAKKVGPQSSSMHCWTCLLNHTHCIGEATELLTFNLHAKIWNLALCSGAGRGAAGPVHAVVCGGDVSGHSACIARSAEGRPSPFCHRSARHRHHCHQGRPPRLHQSHPDLAGSSRIVDKPITGILQSYLQSGRTLQ